MFGYAQFAKLYRKLGLEMIDCDCGIRCGKYCCGNDGQTDIAFKYLLPGEAEYLVSHGYHQFAELEDFGFLIHFHSKEQGQCACQNIRAHRPFCCRMFPFRPLIDEEQEKVVDLIKSKNERFSPCWVEEPLPAWRGRAVNAWNYLFSDPCYLRFYAQYYLCLKKSETSTASFAQAMTEDEIFRRQIEGLSSLPVRELWSLCAKFFSYI